MRQVVCRRVAAVGSRHIVLVGLMGSGKTTVGAALAERLGRPHLDSDADLQSATGRSARDLATQDGVDALHLLEVGHLLTAIGHATPAVISAAAAVIDDEAGRAALASPAVQVAWLRISPAAAARRGVSGSHRPWHEDLATQATRRDPWFAAVAGISIDAGAASATEIVERLEAWAALPGPTRGRTG